MTTIYILDVDGTLANCEARARLLQHECIQCLGVLSGIKSSRDFVCPYCGCMDANMTSESWDTFCADHLVLQDGVISGSKNCVKALEALGHPVHYLTARPLESYDITLEWLKRHFGFNSENQILQTREAGCRVPSDEFKDKAFRKMKFILDERHDNPNYVFVDDNHDNLRMFSGHGLAFEAPHFWDAMHTY